MQDLPDGDYPFIDRRFPLRELAMREAPRDLEDFLKAAALKSGAMILRGEPVELTCEALGFPDATFLVYWPLSSDRLHILVPKESVVGKA